MAQTRTAETSARARPGARWGSTVPALLIAARDLRASSVAMSAIALRGTVVVVLLLAVASIARERTARGAAGLTLLSATTNLDQVLIVVCGIALFPALIAHEREQKTWALLRLAGVGPTSFLLGRSLGALIGMLLVILVQAPFLLFAVALGGTSAAMVGGSIAVLAAHALAVYGLALAAAARAPTVRAATVRAVVLLLLFVFGADLWLWLFPGFGAVARVASYQAHSLLAELRGGAALAEVAAGILVQLAVAGVALTCAWWTFDPHDSERAAFGRRTRRRGGRFPAGIAAVRQATARQATGGAIVWCLLLGATAVLIAILTGRRNPGFAISALLLHALVLLAIAPALASRSIRTHTLAGTVPLLELCHGRAHAWLGGVRLARWRTLGVCCFGYLAAWGALAISISSNLWLGEFAFLLLAVLGAVGLGDAVGERCALRGQRAPWAVALLVMVGVVVLLWIVGFLFQPQSIAEFFSVHAAFYACAAFAVWRTNERAAHALCAR